MSLLEVNNLTIAFGNKKVVDSISFSLDKAARIGLIGESGSGKSMTSLAIMGLLPDTATVSGSITFEGQELIGLSDRDHSRLRGNRIGMVFQEPLTALNPLMRIGKQIAGPLMIHKGQSLNAGLENALELCTKVGLPDPDRILRAYPHQLSGGQRQRIGLAIALACDPALLIADEPTTALDVTVQQEVLNLINTLVQEERSSLVFVTHDLPVVAAMTENVAVMQLGKIVENASVATLFHAPAHEYSRRLISAARSAEDSFSGKGAHQ